MKPFRCQQESLQDSATLHFTGSHIDNEQTIYACKPSCGDIKSAGEGFCYHLSLMAGHIFCAKVLRTAGTASAACAFVRRVCRQPSANFLVP